MPLYVVIEIQGGVPSEVTAFTDPAAASRHALELARGLDLLRKPRDWDPQDGDWQGEEGSTRSWLHHWYSDEHDVVVAECSVRQSLAPA
jgi:hypothetical protein